MAIPASLSHLIYSFHMPFFFLTSGLMFSPNKPIKQSIIRESKKLLFPYLTCSIIVLAISSVYQEDWLSYIKTVLHNGWGFFPLWFIGVLYFARIIFFVICSNGGGRRAVFIRAVCGILVSTVVGASLSARHIVLPYNLSSVFAALSFLLIGFLLKNLLNRIKYFEKAAFIHGGLSLLSLICCIVISHFFYLDMCINQILPIIPIYSAAIAGTLMVMSISIVMSGIYHFPILSSCGKNTFVLMAFTMPFMNVIRSLIGNSVIELTILSTLIRWTILVIVFAILFRLKKDQLKWLFNYDAFIDKIGIKRTERTSYDSQ